MPALYHKKQTKNTPDACMTDGRGARRRGVRASAPTCDLRSPVATAPLSSSAPAWHTHVLLHAHSAQERLPPLPLTQRRPNGRLCNAKRLRDNSRHIFRVNPKPSICSCSPILLTLMLTALAYPSIRARARRRQHGRSEPPPAAPQHLEQIPQPPAPPFGLTQCSLCLFPQTLLLAWRVHNHTPAFSAA